jgi:hypothetical protein
MPRGLTSILQTEIAQQSIKPIALVRIAFSTEQKITNHYKDLLVADKFDDALGTWDNRGDTWDTANTYTSSSQQLRVLLHRSY